MVKASLRLTNGTQVTLEGNADEVHRLLGLYGGNPGAPLHSDEAGKPLAKPKSRGGKSSETTTPNTEQVLNLIAIANKVKECDEAEEIEKRILDRSSQVDRTLLPLYIVHEYFPGAHGLTSGEISKITSQLGIPIHNSNVSRTLSVTARKYVLWNKERVKGARCALSRRGVKYLKAVISETANG